MAESELESLQAALRRRWPSKSNQKVEPYIGAFFDGVRRGTTLSAKVEGNHGIYSVTIQVSGKDVTAACSCYIGKGGYCHHCEALAQTFLKDSTPFREIQQTSLPRLQKKVKNLEELEGLLEGVTLDSLLTLLKENGISQKAFAESIGMNPRHLTTVKSSELRNHFFYELGATKLACLWVLTHIAKAKLE